MSHSSIDSVLVPKHCRITQKTYLYSNSFSAFHSQSADQRKCCGHRPDPFSHFTCHHIIVITITTTAYKTVLTDWETWSSIDKYFCESDIIFALGNIQFQRFSGILYNYINILIPISITLQQILFKLLDRLIKEMYFTQNNILIVLYFYQQINVISWYTCKTINGLDIAAN